MEENEEALLNRLSLDPNDADAEYSLGCLLLKNGRADEGFASLRRSIALRPDGIDARRALAFALRHEERFEEAEKALREWQRYDPESPFPRHMLAAFGKADVPPRAADDYIRLMFDRVASEFDENLASVGYRGPDLISQALAAALGAPAAALDILDAGCGTGLCGPAARPYARRLAGVDLSAGMLAQAAARKCYDRLECAELTGFMANRPKAFDLVISADTLNYFGDLMPALSAIATALRPEAWLIFTLEAGTANSPASRLNPNGRFTHEEGYVRQAVADSGLKLRAIVSDFLRYEAGPLVAGFVVTAQKMGINDGGEA